MCNDTALRLSLGGLLSVIAVFGFASVSIAQNAADLATCRVIPDVDARVRCYDRVADELTGKARARATRPAPVQEPADAGPTKPVEDATPAIITATLDRVGRSPTNKLLLFTTDAGVWIQNDSQLIATLPAPGALIEIRKGALGSHFCQLTRSVSIRCARRGD